MQILLRKKLLAYGVTAHNIFNSLNSNNVRANLFAERIVTVWNRLPSEIVNFNFLSTFN